MKISIIGGGNMGGAIARGLSSCSLFHPQEITVINRRASKTDEMKVFNSAMQAVTNDYSSLAAADIVVIAVKPWMVESLVKEHLSGEKHSGQIIISVAAGISLEQLEAWAGKGKPLYCAIPNTAIEVKQSMTFLAGLNTTGEQDKLVLDIFNKLGKAELVEERLLGPASTLCSCGIAFAFRYIRAAMEGGVEMGLYPQKAKEGVLQTLRGAVELLEHSGAHPEQEVDKVTTAGGITIKGLNEMEHAGFTSAVIRGLKASNNG